jgi:hypothetical protein
LLYYIDEDIPYYRVMAKNNLSQDKYNEYIKELKNEFKIVEKK